MKASHSSSLFQTPAEYRSRYKSGRRGFPIPTKAQFHLQFSVLSILYISYSCVPVLTKLAIHRIYMDYLLLLPYMKKSAINDMLT